MHCITLSRLEMYNEQKKIDEQTRRKIIKEKRRKKLEEERKKKEKENEFNLNTQDLDILERVVMAESGYTEPDYGVALVADAVLNRMLSNTFPNTVTEVVTQPHQFSTLFVLYNYTPTDRVKRIVAQELHKRQNKQVIYFASNGWLPYGSRMFKVGGHYFSSE